MNLDKTIDRLAAQISSAVRQKVLADLATGIDAPTEKKTRAPFETGCRHKGCKKRNKGPRFSFLCEDHRKKTVAAKVVKKAKPAVAKPAVSKKVAKKTKKAAKKK